MLIPTRGREGVKWWHQLGESILERQAQQTQEPTTVEWVGAPDERLVSGKIVAGKMAKIPDGEKPNFEPKPKKLNQDGVQDQLIELTELECIDDDMSTKDSILNAPICDS